MTEPGEGKCNVKFAAKTAEGTVVTNPPIARLLFDDTRFAVVWLVVRVPVGRAWIDVSTHKLGNPAWMQTGEALKGYWTNAVAVPAAPAKPAIAFDWYRADSGRFCRHRGLPGWVHELELCHGWFRHYRPGAVCGRYLLATGLENSSLLWRGSVPAAASGHTVESAQIRTCYGEGRAALL